eukprot:TRINITY_DN2346_c0_g1_i1.p1 TRINITY_DN2346_c0_g1~~TRINITY_DN2346_c0_g1_i1.p1  ORF type:complete len:526 (+),score=180.53 TRINITY_DN2346_c0_g1_i1:49-1626(+)
MDSKKESKKRPAGVASSGPQKKEKIEKTGFFSDDRFDSLDLQENTKKAIRDMGFESMTRIQAKSIGPLMEGRDLLGAAKTGSGKTLAFLVPTIDNLAKIKVKTRNGTGIIVVTPTRELALQIYSVVEEVCAYLPITHGIIMGGANRRTEADRLKKGVNVLIATPGRLLDHMQNTKGFVYKNLVSFIIDEADRILDVGFEEQMHAIVKCLPKKRQSVLFSATQTKNVADLARVAVKKPIYVNVDEEDAVATVNTLVQGYVVCPAEKRFLLLYSFLKKNKDKKIMVFFSSCNAVKYYGELLNYIDLPVLDIYGKQKQSKRTSTFMDFCNATKGIMLCTDVAARGLDIPSVDWIVQFDPSDDPKEYIHRVGRTARGSKGSGRALLFLLPEELGFLNYLRASKVTLNEFEFPQKKIKNIQPQLEKIISSTYYLHQSSKEAYKGYVLAYASHGMKSVFDVHKLDLAAVGKSFGLTAPPRVDLKLKSAGKKGRRGGKNFGSNKKAGGSGHSFSADNPYGKKGSGDKRQFQH